MRESASKIIELLEQQRAIIRERLTEVDLKIARLRAMEPDAPHIYKPEPQPAPVAPACEMLRTDDALHVQYHGAVQRRRMTVLGFIVAGQTRSADIARQLQTKGAATIYNDLMVLRSRGLVRQTGVHTWEATEEGAAKCRESA